MLAFHTGMEQQSLDFSPDELRAALAGRNANSATHEEIVAARSAILGNLSGAYPLLPGRQRGSGYFGQALSRWIGFGVTAAAIMAVIGAAHFYTLQPRQRTTSITVTMREVRTGIGKRATLRLADGTMVTLNADSKLRYPESFCGSAREVQVDGEALFDVTQNSADPFVVKTGNVLTRVLGTRFVVRKYADDPVVQVVVAQGRVALGPAVLSEGDEGTATEGGEISTRKHPNLNAALAWTAGDLVFDKTPLRSVIPDLRRWYGIDIVVTDVRLLGDPITTVFREESRDQVIDALARVLNARAERSGMRVVLSRR